MENTNLGKMGKDKYVIKTGAGDYLKRGYPHVIKNSIKLSFVKDISQARIFNEYRKADEVRKGNFMAKCSIVKIEND